MPLLCNCNGDFDTLSLENQQKTHRPRRLPLGQLMKILQLAPLLETVPPPAYGGTEAVIHVLTEELVARGHEVTLCASGDSSTSAELFSVFPQSLRPAGLDKEPLQYALMHVAASLKLAESGCFDIVHSHTGPPSELGMALSHMTDRPILTTLHNQLKDDTRFIWSNYKGWYNTISETQSVTQPRLARARFAGVVYNAIDVQSFPFQAEKEDYVLFVGRMTATKAPHLAVEAARKAGLRIVLAGKVALTEEREYFDAVLRPLIDGKNVEFVGEADAQLKRRLYAGARALLLPLQWDEPFGLVMIEAMACGTPAVVFPRGAAPEVIRHGETGFLVDDVDGMAHVLMSDVENIDPWACRSHVEDRFAAATLADGYLAIYERMLGVREKSHDRVHA
jgi:glycosyltransferase involved in cell wall biosynthesis